MLPEDFAVTEKEWLECSDPKPMLDFLRGKASDRKLRLARLIYDERGFERMLELADALEEAGCDNDGILSHCRGPGPHVRGCWVVDLVLGKE
jgi:hypothetical protein